VADHAQTDTDFTDKNEKGFLDFIYC